MDEPVSLAEATAFGIEPSDELAHAYDPQIPSWNESWFFDWFDAQGTRAGHCRIARMPNQGRAFLWLFVYDGKRWIAIEEARLPSSALEDGPRLSLRGLRLSLSPHELLRRGELAVEGFGRVISGENAGSVLPLSMTLDYRAVGPAHSLGAARGAGHSSAKFPASRFEQPIQARVVQTIGDKTESYDARGERDHSWGPRHWNMEWTFLVLHGPVLRVQCARVTLGMQHLHVGYLGGSHTSNVRQAAFDLTFREESIEHYVAGNVRVEAEDTRCVEGTVTSITGAEMDISHCFEPPRASVYRRNLVRFLPKDGGEETLGWLESNRFPKGTP